MWETKRALDQNSSQKYKLLSLYKLIQMSRNFLNFSCTKNILSLIIQILKICWTKYRKLCQRVLTNKRHMWLKPWRKNLGLKWLVLIRKNVEGFIEFLWWSKCFEQLTEKKIAKKCVNKSVRLQGIFCMRLHTEDIVKLWVVNYLNQIFFE